MSRILFSRYIGNTSIRIAGLMSVHPRLLESFRKNGTSYYLFTFEIGYMIEEYLRKKSKNIRENAAIFLRLIRATLPRLTKATAI